MAKRKKPVFGVQGGLSHTKGGLADIRKAFPQPKKKASTRNTQPTTPPYGSYDPGLDQQERSATRGLGYLIDDIRRGNDIAGQDLGIGIEGVERSQGRSLADLMTARNRATQDAGTQTQALGTQYARLGSSQTQAARASGNLGGAIEQARRKRAENQAVDQSGIDTSLRRYLEDNDLSVGRVNEAAGLGIADLRLGYTRGVDDRTIQQTRAEDENLFFGQDVNETRIDQAKQAGLLPAGFGSQKPAGRKPGAKPRKPRAPRVRVNRGRASGPNREQGTGRVY